METKKCFKWLSTNAKEKKTTQCLGFWTVLPSVWVPNVVSEQTGSSFHNILCVWPALLASGSEHSFHFAKVDTMKRKRLPWL